MTDPQKEIIKKLASSLYELSNECASDSSFFEAMAKIGDSTQLIPFSLDEMADEWLLIAKEEETK